MKIPKPYFSGVLHYGDLEMEQIIVEYTYPLLSVLTDRQKNRYLCLCFEIRDAQKWLIVPISTEELIGLLNNEVTLAAPFEQAKSAVLAIRNFDTNNESFSMIPAEDFPNEALPVAGAYLDAEDDEWADYIRTLRAKGAKRRWYSVGNQRGLQMFLKSGLVHEDIYSSYNSNNHWQNSSGQKTRELGALLCQST